MATAIIDPRSTAGTAIIRGIQEEDFERIWGQLGVHGVDSVPLAQTLFSRAAEVLPILPKVPGADNLVLTRADFRDFARQSISLVKGGEGLIANFVETMIELNAQGFENRMGLEGQGNQNYIDIYNTFARLVNADAKTGASLAGKRRGLDQVMRQFIWQWWTTGLIVLTYTWGPVPIPKLNYKSYQVPREMTILDPLRIQLEDLALKGIIWYEIPQTDRDEIRKQVVEVYGNDPSKHPLFMEYPVKPVDKKKPGAPQNIFSAAEAYQILLRDNKLPLNPATTKIVRRSFDPSEIYPMPFPARIFASTNDKRMLRNMDRSLIRKVIMMILKIAVDSPDPRRPVNDKDLKATEDRIKQQFRADPEYLHILTCTKGTTLEWVIPEVNAILNRDRYRTLDYEMLAAMLGLASNMLLNSTGAVDMALIGKQLWGKNQLCVQDFKRLLEELYDEITGRSGIRAIRPTDVNVVFKQITLFETEQFKTFIANMVMRGMLPAKFAIDHLGEDYQTAIEYLVKEEELRQTKGIFKTPPTNNQITDNNPGDGKESGPGGRPPGESDSQPREDNTGPDPTDDGAPSE